MTIRIALVGLGKIARAEHFPVIAADERYRLAAVVTRGDDPGAGVPFFDSVTAMVAAMPGAVDAVALCTPPAARFEIAREAISAGLGVLLEKPPAVTLGEIAELKRLARAADTPLYTAWHSQHAPGVAKAAEVLAGQTIASVRVVWCEDVRKWHPGQQWVWQPGGFGVFDPGINGLSILTRILPSALLVKQARLLVPANRQAPIAAEITFAGTDSQAHFDWRGAQTEQWSVTVTTASGMTIELQRGGHALSIDGTPQDLPVRREYPAIYDHFAEVVRRRRVDVDAEPLRIAADAFLCGARETIEAFVE
jgi:predicted dehydrogenase